MKQLKLQVGKTYRSREGEEVKIIEKIGKGNWRYGGNNSKWYTESGGWDVCGAEHPEDLIEETTRHTFDIPNGVKKVTVEQVGNRIVVEMVPEDVVPKPGDIVFEDGRIMIVKKYPNLYHAMLYGNNGNIYINREYGIPFTSAAFRLATDEEAQLLFDALKKAGKRWNPETMQVEDVPERDRIREWVEIHLNDGYYNQQGIAEVIGHYLKHREGEKCTNTNI